MSKTEISWSEHVFNPLVGCSIPTNPATGRPRPGCCNCYASKSAPHRFASRYERDGVVVLRGKAKKPGLTWVPKTPKGKSLGKGAQWTGEVRLLPWVLEKPLRRRVPTTYFVNSLSDLFHENLVDCDEGRRYISAVFGVFVVCPQHTNQVLTKRPHKSREWFAWSKAETESNGFESMREMWVHAANDALRGIDPKTEIGKSCWNAADVLLDRWRWGQQGEYAFEADDDDDAKRIDRLLARLNREFPDGIDDGMEHDVERPLPNVHLGTSVEDQDSADWAIPELLQVPAAVHWISAEPLLGPVDLNGLLVGRCGSVSDGSCGDNSCRNKIQWVVCGGESGAGARPCEVRWLRGIIEQCKAAAIPVWTKQLGAAVHTDEDFPFSPSVDGRVHLDDAKGANMAEWPEDLRVREMPEAP